MVLYNLHLISLVSGISPHDIIHVLKRKQVKPLLQARVLRWIILPSSTSTAALLAQNIQWDMLLILPGDSSLPLELRSFIRDSWSANLGIPSGLLRNYESLNSSLLHPSPTAVKAAEPSSPNSASSQPLALSAELADWISSLPFPTRFHPVSMLNLLKFAPSPNAKDSYKAYGQEFARRIGSRHGGNAKIVAHVVESQAKEQGWDEVAVAHYPTLDHFAAMLSSEDYQAINQQYRLGALADTFILCTQEIDDDGRLVARSHKASL